MSDLLNIGSSALLAYRSSLATISNNIANANTVGYTRERANLQALPGEDSSVGQVGNGVQVSSVQRIVSTFLETQLNVDTSSLGRADIFQTYASQIDQSLSDANTSLAGPLQGFFDAMNGVSANPTSTAARQTLLASAQQLTASLSNKQSQLDGLDQQISSDLANTATDINNVAAQIAALNQQILSSQGRLAGQSPNDLLDQRDQAVLSLAKDTGLSTTTNADGTINVYMASGQPLVLGTVANSLSVQRDAYGSSDIIVLKNGGQNLNITSQVSGGQLGGLLDLRKQVVVPAIDQIGRIAVALGQAVNAQSQAGMDLYGQLGGAFFSTPGVNTVSAATNTGTASVTATVSNSNLLGSGDYVLQNTASGWTLTDQSTGAQVALSGAGTAASPLTGGGLSLVLSGTAGTGDKYLIQPTRFAAGQLSVQVSDPAAISAAVPVQTAAALSNVGNATISGATINNAANAALLSTVQIQFTSATTYTINGGPAQAYTSGGSISVNGWTVQISGTPGTGDSFTVKATQPGSSDGSNAVLMAGIASQKILSNGVNTLSSANATLVSNIGSQAQQATAQLSAFTALVNQDKAARDSISGVNLDEEAAALTQFQQAYQAAAQVIATSNQLFQSLISALR